MHKCMYMYMHAQVFVCMCGLTEDGGMGGFECVHVCVCMHVYDPACIVVTLCARIDRCIDARSDGQTDGWIEHWIAEFGYMDG